MSKGLHQVIARVHWSSQGLHRASLILNGVTLAFTTIDGTETIMGPVIAEIPQVEGNGKPASTQEAKGTRWHGADGGCAGVRLGGTAG